MPTGLGLRPGAKAPDEPPTPYRLRASPRLYKWRQHAWKRGMDATREALPVAWHAPTDSPRGSGRAGRVAERSVGTEEAG